MASRFWHLVGNLVTRPFPSIATHGRDIRRGYLSLLGAATTALPALLHNASISPIWIGFGAAVGLFYAGLAMRPTPRACGPRFASVCILATGIGMSLDFARIPPVAILSFCSTWRFPLLDGSALVEHARCFPCTLSIMAALIAIGPHSLRRWGVSNGHVSTLAFLLPNRLIEVALMAVCMPTIMMIGRQGATALALPMTADSLVCLMLASMLLTSALSQLLTQYLAHPRITLRSPTPLRPQR